MNYGNDSKQLSVKVLEFTVISDGLKACQEQLKGYYC